MILERADLLRWFRISCRTAHLAGMCGLVGGLLFGVAAASLPPWLVATVLSGGLLAATDVYEEGPYFTEIRGAAMVLKLMLLVVAWAVPAACTGLLFAVIVLSSVVSHAPGKVRHRSLRLRQPPGPPPAET